MFKVQGFRDHVVIQLGSLNLLQLLCNRVEGGEESPTLHTARYYIKTMRNYGFATVYFLTMIYMTFDKFLDIYLSVTYHLHCNEQRTKKLLIVTWCTTLSSAVAVAVSRQQKRVILVFSGDVGALDFLREKFFLISTLIHRFKGIRRILRWPRDFRHSRVFNILYKQGHGGTFPLSAIISGGFFSRIPRGYEIIIRTSGIRDQNILFFFRSFIISARTSKHKNSEICTCGRL